MYRLVLLLLVLVNYKGDHFVFAGKHIDDRDLWEHVVTIDRLAWSEREGSEKINTLVKDQEFVRRIYLDISGKVPTYEQFVSFIKSKDVNKREKLISKLLDTPGYAIHMSNFWLDLLRVPYGDLIDFNHKEFNRYIERSLFENKSYDNVVKELILAEGPISTNPQIGFYRRDFETNVMDTLNASVRAFLGTRIGCAQCHNHRFDKWTQKEFYESAALLWGVQQKRQYSNPQRTIIQFHGDKVKNNPKYKKYMSENAKLFLKPSRAELGYSQKNLKYPENYIYNNAKPNEVVKERIVFDYGDLDLHGENPREHFANWLASKENIMFSKIMANRLWKRIMGGTMMEPIDDWKDNLKIKNPELLDGLGKIFMDVGYDFKAFLSIVFNTEAYQLSVDHRHEIKSEDYNFQGAMLKRMSAQQISDSLLTLKRGDLDNSSKLDYAYFEFEDEMNKLLDEYMKELVPLVGQVEVRLSKREETVRPEVMELMETYLKKLKELEDYHNIGKNGLLTTVNSRPRVTKTVAKVNDKSDMMMNAGSTRNNMVLRSNYTGNEFMNTFGAHDRSSPETALNTGATMKQILKMMSSDQCKDVVKKDSQLMIQLNKYKSLSGKITYLYASIYGREPNKKEFSIASKFLDDSDKKTQWETYIIALLNSPEFYFIK